MRRPHTASLLAGTLAGAITMTLAGRRAHRNFRVTAKPQALSLKDLISERQRLTAESRQSGIPTDYLRLNTVLIEIACRHGDRRTR